MAARKQGRRRGVVLTMVGSQKLQAARLASERSANFGVRYTNEELVGITGLSLMTLAKIFPTTSDLQIPVDKKTLDRCFRGFDSILERGDYAYIDNTEILSEVAVTSSRSPIEGELVEILADRRSAIASMCFSPDGLWLAIGGIDGVAQLWEVATCQLLRTFTGHDRSTLTVAFSPDSRQLATAGDDLTIKIWEIETGKLLQTLLGHVDRVNSICYSPDGKSIYSASEDEILKICDLGTGNCNSLRPYQ
jgi:WD40 repeat protein